MSDEIETTNDDELAKVREALKSANNEAASHRHKATELEDRLTQAEANATKFKASYMQAKIAEALKDHGATNPKIVRVLDSGQIDLDDSGELIGFDEQLTQIKSEFPEFFDAKRSVARIDAADKPKTKKTLTSAEKLIRRAKA